MTLCCRRPGRYRRDFHARKHADGRELPPRHFHPSRRRRQTRRRSPPRLTLSDSARRCQREKRASGEWRELLKDSGCDAILLKEDGPVRKHTYRQMHRCDDGGRRLQTNNLERNKAEKERFWIGGRAGVQESSAQPDGCERAKGPGIQGRI